MLVVLLVNSRLYHYLAQMLLFVEQLSPILSKNKMPNENFLLSNFITDPINTVVGNGAVLNKIFKSAENHFELDLDSNYCSVTPWHVWTSFSSIICYLRPSLRLPSINNNFITFSLTLPPHSFSVDSMIDLTLAAIINRNFTLFSAQCFDRVSSLIYTEFYRGPGLSKKVMIIIRQLKEVCHLSLSLFHLQGPPIEAHHVFVTAVYREWW